MRQLDQETIDTIIKMYEDKISITDISKSFNGSPSTGTIKKYLIKNGVFRPRKFHGEYSYEDCLHIGELYKADEWDEIYSEFPGITKHTVYTICSKLKIRKDEYFWSEEDTELLKTNYNKLNQSELSELMENRHTKGQIRVKALKMGLGDLPNYWTQEEDDIMRAHYSEQTKSEMLELLPNRTWAAIIIRAGKLNLTNSVIINERYSDEQKQFIADNFGIMTDVEIAEVLGKPLCGVQEQRRRMGLYYLNKDYSNYENLQKFFRGHIQNWKNKSMEQCGYQCVLTGDNDFDIHHIIGFNTILKEALDEMTSLGITIHTDICYYSKEELDEILLLFNRIHDKYPLGVCIRKDIHVLFHSIYGSGGNTEQQWNQFVKDYKDGIYR